MTEAATFPTKTLRKDAAQNRERLLAAAQQVFARHGLDASVEEVARAAGVGMGTLYRRFPTKDALIAELVADLIEQIHVLARHELATSGGHGLENFLYATGDLLAANRGCLPRLWNDPTTLPRKNASRVAIAELLDDAQANGVIRADATITDIDLLFWSLRGILVVTKGTAGVRRHIATVIAGWRPNGTPLCEPAIRDEGIV